MSTDDRIARIRGDRTPYARGGTWPQREDQHLASGIVEADVDGWVRTASTLLYYVGRDLAGWSAGHGREIAAIASEFGQDLDPSPEGAPSVVDRARRWMSERSARSSEMELVTVRDLREIYLRASGVLVDWEMIGQAAPAIAHDDLLALATKCQAETKRQATWANSKIKESSTQALVA